MDVDVKPLLQCKITVVIKPNLHSKYLQPYLITLVSVFTVNQKSLKKNILQNKRETTHTKFLSNICKCLLSFHILPQNHEVAFLKCFRKFSWAWGAAGKNIRGCINTCDSMHLILLRHQASPLVCFKVGEKFSGAANMQPNSTSN